MPKSTHSPLSANLIQRFGATVVDVLIVGGFLQIICLLFPDWVSRLGPYGRFIGFIPALAYFSILNSSWRNGQTFGQQLIKIVVTDERQERLGFKKSFWRSLVALTPFLLYKLQFPFVQDTPILRAFSNQYFLGVMIASFLLLVINRSTHQSLHDILSGTFVLQRAKSRQHNENTPLPASPLYRPLTIGLIIGAILITLTAVLFSQKPAQENSVSQMRQLILADGRFFDASISSRVTRSNNAPIVPSLNVDVWYKGRFTEEEGSGVISDIGRIILTSGLEIPDGYELQIILRSNYDLFLATGGMTLSKGTTLDDWYEMLGLTK